MSVHNPQLAVANLIVLHSIQGTSYPGEIIILIAIFHYSPNCTSILLKLDSCK